MLAAVPARGKIPRVLNGLAKPSAHRRVVRRRDERLEEAGYQPAAVPADVNKPPIDSVELTRQSLPHVCDEVRAQGRAVFAATDAAEDREFRRRVPLDKRSNALAALANNAVAHDPSRPIGQTTAPGRRLVPRLPRLTLVQTSLLLASYRANPKRRATIGRNGEYAPRIYSWSQ